jgi:metallophosphoesterase (TIGR03768 family)
MPNSHTGRRVSRRRILIGGAAAGTFLATSAYPVAAMAAAVTGTAAAASPAAEQQVQAYPISSDVQTTRQRTVVPDVISAAAAKVPLSAIAQFKANGIGAWHYGPGIDAGKRLDLMPATYSGASATSVARLLRFFTISDLHVTDKESPSQLIYLQQMSVPGHSQATSIYSPVMMYTTHVLDAVVQTINALHKHDPIDFGLSLGDTCNCTQYNELRWYIDILDGTVITPSSGAHAGALTIDYQKPYQAAGLDKAIPWYQTIGNHDHFWIGSLPVDSFLRQSFLSDTVIASGDVLVNPTTYQQPDYYMGVIDGSTPLGNIIDAGPVADFASPPKVVPDPNRRSLLKTEWMNEFFTTSSAPVGHGFQRSNVDSDFTCYSFVPKSDVPIRILMLDDTQASNDGSPDIHGHGYLDQARWTWLKAELAAGQAAGQLMIIGAHIPIGVEPETPQAETCWWLSPLNAVDQAGLIAELQKYPNFILWVAGHRHLNTVKPFVSPDPINHPEYGFWQVETSSLRAFPQQFRTFDIVLNDDGTVSVITTDVDPAVADGTPAAMARMYAVAAQQLDDNNVYQKPNPTNDPSIASMPTGSYNAELVVALTAEMQAKLGHAVSALQGAAAQAAGGAPAPTSGGALPITDTWLPLAVGQRAWHAFQYDGTGAQITIRMATSPASAASFTVWTPAQADLWTRTGQASSVGQGTANASMGGDYVWSGNFNSKGTYYVVVDQKGPVSGSYCLQISGTGVSR